jgi:hypothetical protein
MGFGSTTGFDTILSPLLQAITSGIASTSTPPPAPSYYTPTPSYGYTASQPNYVYGYQPIDFSYTGIMQGPDPYTSTYTSASTQPTNYTGDPYSNPYTSMTYSPWGKGNNPNLYTRAPSQFQPYTPPPNMYYPTQTTAPAPTAVTPYTPPAPVTPYTPPAPVAPPPAPVAAPAPAPVGPNFTDFIFKGISSENLPGAKDYLGRYRAASINQAALSNEYSRLTPEAREIYDRYQGITVVPGRDETDDPEYRLNLMYGFGTSGADKYSIEGQLQNRLNDLDVDGDILNPEEYNQISADLAKIKNLRGQNKIFI